MNAKPGLSDHVVVDTSSERANRIWRATESRLAWRDRWLSWRSGWAPRVVVAGALLVLAFVSGRATSPARLGEPAAWTRIETGDDAVELNVRDGSSVRLGALTRATLLDGEETRIGLERGRVDCSVVHRAERSFTVAAGAHEVRVRGTRFSVELSERRLTVEVREGRVDVSRQEDEWLEASLGVGGRWSIDLRPEDLSRSTWAPAASRHEPLAAGAFDAGAGGEVDSAGEVDADDPDERAVPPELGRHAPSPPPAERRQKAGGVRPRAAGARQLLQHANEARRTGDVARAVEAYEALVARYPDDPRVGLAAFELGRLRMDRLGEWEQALGALELAERMAPEPALREAASARIVEALQLLGDIDACQERRAAHLQNYPNGTHEGLVRLACDVLP